MRINAKRVPTRATRIDSVNSLFQMEGISNTSTSGKHVGVFRNYEHL
ncbi:MAG: hypothetical protein QF560_07850 [SAR324 cluster bacterium]|jgi:hypothetical protein|nr:hypothetical protein [SAR324 cluster bacterium]MDP7138269.1 hypothetical protein [SAR324 cluster bacterium]MEE1577029.1 hypothetical protein [Deltaproteobacteria bacterium]|tara:strand:- start:547 stop:687 length:141 start_codon:yes stop_codon:yes gene_type:complete